MAPPDQIQAMDVERSVKAQYAKAFASTDWKLFKWAADSLFREAAFVKTRDMRFVLTSRLLARNSRKRLLIGVATEFLLKAVYLKKGYGINKLRQGAAALQFPYSIPVADGASIDEADTFQLGKLIDHLPTVLNLAQKDVVLKGLRIAKVFRNKEGHVVTDSHSFDASNYRDIEATLRSLYRQTFDQVLTVRFSLAPKEVPRWRISSPNTALQGTRRKRRAR
jgi:hypothetical protein